MPGENTTPPGRWNLLPANLSTGAAVGRARRRWRQDLAWAAFILAVAVGLGVVQHWSLVRISLQGGLNAHLDKVRQQRRAVRFEGVKTVSLLQAYHRLQQGNTLFVDARKADEYAELHIPGALNLIPEQLAEGGESLVAGIPKDRDLVVYCDQAHCDDSLKVAEKLQALGFTRVHAFLGGFRAWDEAGYPVDTKK